MIEFNNRKAYYITKREYMIKMASSFPRTIELRAHSVNTNLQSRDNIINRIFSSGKRD